MLSRASLQNTSALTIVTALGLGFLAWGGTHAYIYFCAPAGLTGFLQSLVTMDSSPCQALFALITHSHTLYTATVASLLCAAITFVSSYCARATPPCPPCDASRKTS